MANKNSNGGDPIPFPTIKRTFANRREYFESLFTTALVATVNTDDLKGYLDRYNVSTSEIRIEVEAHLHKSGFPKGEIQTSVDEDNGTLSWFVPINLQPPVKL